jgi:serine/threonine protein kinase
MREGDRIGDTYVLGEVLGRGGMGIVYAARSLERRVAIKVPRPELADNPTVRAHFHTEARASSRVAHRNIVRILELGEVGGVPFLVMERVAGQRLGEMVAARGTLPLGLAVHIVGQILGGLSEAHASGVIHADLKSDNVLVEPLRDGSLLPRLIDFGLARFVDNKEPASVARMVSGTPEYLAPEVIGGAPPTMASDLYAVGVILYELVVGTTPFCGGTSTEIMMQHLAEAVPVPSSRVRALPRELDVIISRALAKDPRDRFADAGELAEALAWLGAVGTGAGTRSPQTPALARTETPTLRIATQRRSLLEQRYDVIVDATTRRDPDAIIIAYLDLVDTLVDEHRLDVAIAELDTALSRLAVIAPAARAAWRLSLTLAALHAGVGNRVQARAAVDAAHQQATLAGSSVGRARASSLAARLSGRSRRSRGPRP